MLYVRYKEWIALRGGTVMDPYEKERKRKREEERLDKLAKYEMAKKERWKEMAEKQKEKCGPEPEDHDWIVTDPNGPNVYVGGEVAPSKKNKRCKRCGYSPGENQ